MKFSNEGSKAFNSHNKSGAHMLITFALLNQTQYPQILLKPHMKPMGGMIAYALIYIHNPQKRGPLSILKRRESSHFSFKGQGKNILPCTFTMI